MDNPIHSNQCDETAEQSEHIACSENDVQQTSIKSGSNDKVKDVIPPDPGDFPKARLDQNNQEKSSHVLDSDSTCVDDITGHKAIVVDQVILVPASKQVPEIIDEHTDKNSPNKSDLNEALATYTVQTDDQVKEADHSVAVETSKETLNMVTDEPNSENNCQTPTNSEEKLFDVTMSSNSDEQIENESLLNISGENEMLTDSIPEPTLIKIEKDENPDPGSSLALLAQYDTDSDSEDDVREVPVPQTYQNRCVEIDSDSSTSDVEFMSESHGPITLDSLEVDPEEDDEDENVRSSRQPRVKGELHLDDLPPIEDLHITVPEEECTELGSIHSIVEQLVLVNALPGTVPLDLETVLFRDKGKQVLGEIFDVLGQVSDPLYCVRFNSNKEIKEKGIEVGQTIYVAPRTEHTQFIVLANLMKVRGSDASWENDVEPPPRFIDYSDDEEERSARRPNRKRQNSGATTYAGRGSYAPRRPYRGNYSGHGVRQPHHQTPGNYNIVGNSWHSNFYQTPVFNRPPYRMPMHAPSGIRPPMNYVPYQQPVNPGMVINPYAVYPPPQTMEQPLFPPQLHHPPPPPPNQ